MHCYITMAPPKLYRWIWEWSDYGDEIIISHQKFLSLEACQFDALRHYPYIRAGDWSGRTGRPNVRIVEEEILEYKWILVIYDQFDMEIARYSEDVWYESMAECLLASRKLNVKTCEDSSYWEVDFKSRLKPEDGA